MDGRPTSKAWEGLKRLSATEMEDQRGSGHSWWSWPSSSQRDAWLIALLTPLLTILGFLLIVKWCVIHLIKRCFEYVLKLPTSNVPEPRVDFSRPRRWSSHDFGTFPELQLSWLSVSLLRAQLWIFHWQRRWSLWRFFSVPSGSWRWWTQPRSMHWTVTVILGYKLITANDLSIVDSISWLTWLLLISYFSWFLYPV